MTNGTNGPDSLVLTNSPAVAFGRGGDDTLSATLAGGVVLTSSLDGGAGRDSISADGIVDDALGTTILDVRHALNGGTGADTLTAVAIVTGSARFNPNPERGTFTAENIIHDIGAGGRIIAHAEANTEFGSPDPRFGDETHAINRIYTGNGSDHITATAISDVFGLNFIRSGAGKDTIETFIGAPADFYTNDTAPLENNVDAGTGNDVISATIDFYADSGSGRTSILGGAGNDTIAVTKDISGYGSGGFTSLHGQSGKDHISANISLDGFFGAWGSAEIHGGGESDTVNVSLDVSGDGAEGVLRVYGGGAHDYLNTEISVNGDINDGSASQLIDGGAGNDTIINSFSLSSGGGIVTILGGFGNDLVTSVATSRTGYDVGTRQLVYGDGGNDTLTATLDHQVLYSPKPGGNTLGIKMDGGTGADMLRAETTDPVANLHVSGGIGSDDVTATGGSDAFVDGGAGHDTLAVFSLRSQVNGGTGDDVIDADGRGLQLVTGGGGRDRFHFDTSSNVGTLRIVDWDARRDVLVFEDLMDANGDGSLADEISAQIVLAGSDAGGAWIDFAAGGRIQFGGLSPLGDPRDVLSYITGNAALQLVSGTDLLGDEELGQQIVGDDTAEVFKGNPGDDTILAGGGDDTIADSDGDDSVNGENGDDLIYFGAGTDTVDAGAGDDSVVGTAWNGGRFDGGAGFDTLDLSQVESDLISISVAGFESVTFGSGNDRVSGGTSQSMDGGDGVDTLYFFGGGRSVASVDLEAGYVLRSGVFRSISNFEHVIGNSQSPEHLRGDAADNFVSGGKTYWNYYYPGVDTLFGGAGDDTLLLTHAGGTADGGAGDDVIDADAVGVGGGNSGATWVVTGGSGADRFHVNAVAEGWDRWFDKPGLLSISDWAPDEDVLVFEDVADNNLDGSIVDEVNALIVAAGTESGTHWIEFAAGHRINFGTAAPVGNALDITSYVRDDPDAQIVAGVDLLSP